MRLSNTSMFGQSNGLINVNRVNQSVVKQSPSEKGTHMMQIKKDFLTISPQGKSASIIDNLNKQKAHILEMRDQFVENARKQGIGTRLLEDLLKKTKEQGVKKLFLEVRAGNEKAIALYNKMNFKEIGTRKDYYQDPVEDALLMEHEE